MWMGQQHPQEVLPTILYLTRYLYELAEAVSQTYMEWYNWYGENNNLYEETLEYLDPL